MKTFFHSAWPDNGNAHVILNRIVASANRLEMYFWGMSLFS